MKAFLLSVSTINWSSLDTISESLFSCKFSKGVTLKAPANGIAAFSLPLDLKDQLLKTNAWDHMFLSVGFVFDVPQPEILDRLRLTSFTKTELVDPFRGSLIILTGSLTQWLAFIRHYCDSGQVEYVNHVGTAVFNVLSASGFQPILDLWNRESRRDAIILKERK